MSIASIVCVDGELDVHDTAIAAVTAAIERRREVPTAKIGVAVGELEIGDPLGFAKRLCELAASGAILITDTVRRALGQTNRAMVDLGAISISGYLDRVHVFELGGEPRRDRTVLSIELLTHYGRLDPEFDYEAEQREADRRIWAGLLNHGGLVLRTQATDYVAAFATPLAAFRAALAIRRDLDGFNIRVRSGIERGILHYLADRWFGDALDTSQRIRHEQLAATMTAVDGVGAAELRTLGLVIEVVEEVVQRGVRNAVSVAQLRIT